MMFSHYLFISVAYSECLQLPGTVPGTRTIKVVRILSIPSRNSHVRPGKVSQIIQYCSDEAYSSQNGCYYVLLVKCSEILGDGYFLKIEGILSFASISGNLILGGN